MSWLRVDDGAMTHPQVIALRTLWADGKVHASATPCAVLGFVMLAATWSGKHDTDCEIHTGVAPLIDADAWEHLVAAAIKVGMLSKPRRLSDGTRGWLVDIDSGLFHLMSREEKAKNRHRRVTRQDQNRADLHLRDSDLCRYCGQSLNPADTIGGRGREFDHPDPANPDVVVISCRRCNLAKHGRTAEEWAAAGGHALRLPPNPPDRWWHGTTLKWLATRGIDPNRPATPVADPATAARPGSHPAPDAAAPERAPAPPADAAPERQARTASAATAEPDPPATTGTTSEVTTEVTSEVTSEVPPEGVADQHRPGRDGTGRVDGVGLPTPRTRDGPRRRGTRGGRGRRQPQGP